MTFFRQDGNQVAHQCLHAAQDLNAVSAIKLNLVESKTKKIIPGWEVN
jgi:hypothetical protein